MYVDTSAHSASAERRSTRPLTTRNTFFSTSADEVPLTFRIASSQTDRCDAFRLVYRHYVEKEMMPTNRYRLRVTKHHLLATTTVFVAEAAGEIVGTVSLIEDSDLGLPMDRVHAEITCGFRRRGISQAEVSSLAIRQQSGSPRLSMFLGLTRHMAQYARRRGVDQLLVNCIPRHAQFYCRHLGFCQMGGPRAYPQMCNTRGVACSLDLAHLASDHPDVHQCYFGDPLPAAALISTPMSAFERAALGRVLRETTPGLRKAV